MNEIDIKLLMEMVSTGLLFILIITKAYKKSITTTIYISTLFISLEVYFNYSERLAFVTLVIGAAFSLIRAIINNEVDTLLKRGGVDNVWN